MTLRVKPKARADSILGVHGGALKVGVRAAPERGRANAAVIALVADLCEVQNTAVQILAGDTSQDKTVLVRGLDAAALRARIEQRTG